MCYYKKGYFSDPLYTTIAIELENFGPLFLDEKNGFTTVWNTKHNGDYYIYDGQNPLYHASKYYDAYTVPQLQSLMTLIADIESRYGDLIILGHSDIQQIATDPGPAFPWGLIYPEYNSKNF